MIDRPNKHSIGIYGGSFDPPHRGHVDAIAQAVQIGEVCELHVVPCWRHAYDKKMSSFKDRYSMAKLAFGGMDPNMGVVVSPVEKDIDNDKSYMIDTLRAIMEERGTDHFSYAIFVGEDLRDQVKKWKCYDEIIEIARFEFVEERVKIHSTQIREMIKSGKDASKFLIPEIIDYISSRNLYGSGPTTKHVFEKGDVIDELGVSVTS